MVRLILLLMLVPRPLAAQAQGTVEPRATKAADNLARLGQQFLQPKYVSQARQYCQNALLLDPTNYLAIQCLRQVIDLEATDRTTRQQERASAQILAEEEEAEARLRIHQYDKVIALLSKALTLARENQMRDKERHIVDLLGQAQPSMMEGVAHRFTTGWISGAILVVLVIAIVYLVLKLIRSAYRGMREFNFKRFGITFSRRQWSLLPIEDKSGLGVTEGLFEALKRLPKELESAVEMPTILPLRPIAGEPYEPEVWKDYQVAPPRTVKDFENIKFDLDLHEFGLAEAAREMQFRFGGVEIGGLTRLTQGVWRWFNIGVPTITGSVNVSDIGTDKEVNIRITMTEGRNFASINSSTIHRSASNAAQLATERAAYKLLYLVAKPDCAPAEVDAFAARRQGIKLLQQHVSSGRATPDRGPALLQALENFAFARGMLTDQSTVRELHVFEGIVSALLEKKEQAEQHFQTVREFGEPESASDGLVSLQALYNCAVLYQYEGQVDSLTNSIQLYERVMDASNRFRDILEANGKTVSFSDSENAAVVALRSLAEFGRITAAAQYMEEDKQGHALRSVVEVWIKAAEGFLGRTGEKGGGSIGNPLRTNPIADFITLEAHRAFSSLVYLHYQHFELWPFTSKRGELTDESRKTLERAQQSLRLIEAKTLPEISLYQRLVAIQIGLRDFETVREPACKALRMGATEEIFFYAVAAGAKNDGKPLELFQICQAFKGQAKIPEFQEILQEQARAGLAVGLPA
jgi:tetratricopeptide (TPR) repeat protein